MEITLATWNIAHGRGLSDSNWRRGNKIERRTRLEDIAQTLLNLDLDIIVLNEADFSCAWSQLVNHAQFIASILDIPYVIQQPVCSFPLFRYGNAILSRFPVSNPEIVRLPLYFPWQAVVGYRKRAISCTVTPPSGERFKLIGVHFDHRGRLITVPSAQAVIEYVKKQSLPTVVAGDFNSTPLRFPNPRDDQPTAMDRLQESGLFRYYPKENPQPEDMTHPVDDPRCVIDWILIPKQWRFFGYQTVHTNLSDHRLVVATIST
jgi:endonuclease/exonuclease/phosphatase family metal-dependent hydrolase